MKNPLKGVAFSDIVVISVILCTFINTILNFVYIYQYKRLKDNDTCENCIDSFEDNHVFDGFNIDLIMWINAFVFLIGIVLLISVKAGNSITVVLLTGVLVLLSAILSFIFISYSDTEDCNEACTDYILANSKIMKAKCLKKYSGNSDITNLKNIMRFVDDISSLEGKDDESIKKTLSSLYSEKYVDDEGEWSLLQNARKEVEVVGGESKLPITTIMLDELDTDYECNKDGRLCDGDGKVVVDENDAVYTSLTYLTLTEKLGKVVPEGNDPWMSLNNEISEAVDKCKNVPEEEDCYFKLETRYWNFTYFIISTLALFFAGMFEKKK